MRSRRFLLNPFHDPLWNSGPSDSAVYQFHRSLPEYAITPLIVLRGLATHLGVKSIYIKDESHRFGLNAFKVLGASWAIHKLVRTSADAVFCTATDGNHGCAVAWIARKLGHRAVIYVPCNTVTARIEAIQNEGADVVVVDGNYDQAVKQVAIDSALNGWEVISDTSYPGYMEIPELIMTGYSTLFVEIDEQIEELGLTPPEVVFVQAGVGGLLCAASRYYHQRKRMHRPTIISVEPVEADCVLEAISTDNCGPSRFQGNLDSMMAGLNAGTVSLAAWPAVRAGTAAFLSVEDDLAIRAMRLLYHPVDDDPRAISGESGAAGLAGLLALCDPEFLEPKKQIGLSPDTTVLLLNTEGATDPENFARITNSQ